MDSRHFHPNPASFPPARVLEVMETRAERRAAAKLIGGCVAESGKELEQVIRSALPWEGKTEQSHLCSSLRGTIA
jgi:hypothetical protein